MRKEIINGLLKFPLKTTIFLRIKNAGTATRRTAKIRGYRDMFFSRNFVMLATVFCVSLSLAACDKPKDDAQNAAAAPAAMPPASVTVATPLVQPVEAWREFSGRFEATEVVEIRSRVSGYLTKVNFTEGAIVKKGDPLYVIDSRPFEATLRQRQADKTVASSQVSSTQNDYKRAQELFKTGDVAQALLDNRRAAAESAQAAVAAAQAAVDAAALDVTYTRITAPITGRISSNMVATGNLINAGQDVLTTIVSIDPIYFYFDVDEQTFLAYTRAMAAKGTGGGSEGAVGLPVSVALMDEKDYTHAGVMDFIDNQLNQGTGTMRGRAVLQNPAMFFTPGMFGRVRIRTGMVDSGILIPDSAIMVDQSRRLVFVVGANNIVESRTVETGALDKGLRVITKGLDGSELIVVNGLQRAHEGAPVTPEKTTITPTAADAPVPVTDNTAAPTTAPAQAEAGPGAPPAAAPAPEATPEPVPAPAETTTAPAAQGTAQ